MNGDHHIVGRFKKLLGISTFGNGRDSKKDTDTTLKMIKKTGLFTMPWGLFTKNDHHDMVVLLCAKFF